MTETDEFERSENENLRSGAGRVRAKTSRRAQAHPRCRNHLAGRRQPGFHRPGREEIRHPALHRRIVRRHQARRRGDPHHADQDAFPPGRAGDARRQACAGRNPGHRQRRRCRSAGEDRQGNRRHRHGRPCAALQSQPSIRPQEDRRRRAENPADGRADLFLPAERTSTPPAMRAAGPIICCGITPPTPSTCSSIRPAKIFPTATPCRGRSIRSSTSPWTWASWRGRRPAPC